MHVILIEDPQQPVNNPARSESSQNRPYRFLAAFGCHRQRNTLKLGDRIGIEIAYRGMLETPEVCLVGQIGMLGRINQGGELLEERGHILDFRN